MVGGAPEFEGEMMDTRFKSAKVMLVKVRSELGAFAPPLRPPDPVGGTSGLHDGPLIGRTECLGGDRPMRPRRGTARGPSVRSRDRDQVSWPFALVEEAHRIERSFRFSQFPRAAYLPSKYPRINSRLRSLEAYTQTITAPASRRFAPTEARRAGVNRRIL